MEFSCFCFPTKSVRKERKSGKYVDDCMFKEAWNALDTEFKYSFLLMLAYNTFNYKLHCLTFIAGILQFPIVWIFILYEYFKYKFEHGCYESALRSWWKCKHLWENYFILMWLSNWYHFYKVQAGYLMLLLPCPVPHSFLTLADKMAVRDNEKEKPKCSLQSYLLQITCI